MPDLITSIIVSVTGFVVGSVLMILIGSITAKYFVRRIIRDVFSEETKDRVSGWLRESIESAVKDGVGKALKDEKIKKIVEEILETVSEKLR